MKQINLMKATASLWLLFLLTTSAVINLADEYYNGTFAPMLVFPPHDGELKGKSGERPALSP